MEKFNKIKVRDILKKNNLLTQQVINTMYHLNISNCNAEELVYSITKTKSSFGADLAKKLYELIIKCDSNSSEYDYKLDEEMTRFGTRSSAFDGGHCHNKWNTGTFEDDGFGFGTEPTSIYDDYIDSDYQSKLR